MLVHVCDRHEDAKELRPANPVKLALDGVDFETDLCRSCETKLREAMAEWIEAARKPNGSNGRPSPGRAKRTPRTTRITTAVAEQAPDPAPDPAPEPPPLEVDVEIAPSGVKSGDLTREERKGVREWANRNGYHVQPRGSIAQKIVDHYFATAGG